MRGFVVHAIFVMFEAVPPVDSSMNQLLNFVEFNLLIEFVRLDSLQNGGIAFCRYSRVFFF